MHVLLSSAWRQCWSRRHHIHASGTSVDSVPTYDTHRDIRFSPQILRRRRSWSRSSPPRADYDKIDYAMPEWSLCESSGLTIGEACVLLQSIGLLHDFIYLPKPLRSIRYEGTLSLYCTFMYLILAAHTRSSNAHKDHTF